TSPRAAHQRRTDVWIARSAGQGSASAAVRARQRTVAGGGGPASAMTPAGGAGTAHGVNVVRGTTATTTFDQGPSSPPRMARTRKNCGAGQADRAPITAAGSWLSDRMTSGKVSARSVSTRYPVVAGTRDQARCT